MICQLSLFFQFHFVILINFHPGVFHPSSVVILRNEKNIERQIHSKKYMIEMRNSLWSKHPWEQNTSWNENIKHICEREKKTRRWKHESQAAIPTNLGDLKFFVTSVRSKKGFTVMPCFFVVVVGSSSRVKLLIWPCRCLSSVEDTFGNMRNDHHQPKIHIFLLGVFTFANVNAVLFNSGRFVFYSFFHLLTLMFAFSFSGQFSRCCSLSLSLSFIPDQRIECWICD